MNTRKNLIGGVLKALTIIIVFLIIFGGNQILPASAQDEPTDIPEVEPQPTPQEEPVIQPTQGETPTEEPSPESPSNPTLRFIKPSDNIAVNQGELIIIEWEFEYSGNDALISIGLDSDDQPGNEAGTQWFVINEKKVEAVQSGQYTINTDEIEPGQYSLISRVQIDQEYYYFKAMLSITINQNKIVEKHTAPPSTATSHPPCSQSRVYGCELTKIDGVSVYLNYSNYSGTYQCIELVKRFYGQFFSKEIGSVSYAINLFNNPPSEFTKISGSPTDFKPVFGDIVVFKADASNWGQGHTALVRKYDASTRTLEIVEQNYWTSWSTATGVAKIVLGSTTGRSKSIAGFLRYVNNKPVDLLSPINGTSVDTVKLDWSDYGCATCGTIYRLKVASDINFSNIVYDSRGQVTIQSSSFSIVALPRGRTYYWTVKDEYSGRYSSKLSFYLKPFSTPTLISPISTTTKSLRPTFDWSDVPGASRYQIQVSKYGNISNPFISTYVNVSKYTPGTDLPKNTKLYWRVRASDGLNVGPWSTVLSFKTANPPSIPNLVAPTNGATGVKLTPTLDWYNSSLPLGTFFGYYRVQVATDQTFSSPIIDWQVSGRTNSIMTINSGFLVRSKTYYWRVRAYNTLGQYSNWSSIWKFKTY